MTIALYCVLFAGLLVFGAGCLVRVFFYARQPIHLRWEIYPVPRGKPAELKMMVPEIAFLKGLWEFNRSMWLVSYPFHLGMYLLAAGVVLGAGSALFPVLHPAAMPCATAGAVLGLAGAVGLLVKRLTSAQLRVYNTGGDIFNLAFFIVTFSLLLAGYWLRPAGAPGPLAILRGALAWNTTLQPPVLLSAGLASGAVLLAYIPMTHMAHFIAKFFTYHLVRWDERENIAGGALQKRLAEYLMYRPNWSAPHVGADGQRTWVDIATRNPAQGGGK